MISGDDDNDYINADYGESPIGTYGDNDEDGGVENNGHDNVYLITGETLERKIELLPSALPRLSLLIIFIIVFVVFIVAS